LYETSNIIEILYNRSNGSGTSFSAGIGLEDDAQGLAIVVNGSATGAPQYFRLSPYQLHNSSCHKWTIRFF